MSDAVTTTTGGNDLQHGQLTDNYSYDRTGNLIRDKQGAELIDWDHFGKVRSIRDTASNRFIAFGYDGKGNRIWKEVSKPTGAADNREGEYYVRDAGGNILSVYRTHSLYDRALKFTTITGSVIGTTPLASTLASLVDRSFPSGVMGVITTAHSGWLMSYTDRPLSFYMGADPTLKSSLLYSRDSWIDALRSADVSTGATTLRDAFINAGMNVTTMFNAAMTLNTEGHKLFELFSQSMPQASASPVWSAAGTQYIPGNHVANANNLYNATTGNPGKQQLTAQNMASALSVSFTSSPPPPAAFYDDVISGNTLWQSSTLRGANGVWTSEIRNIMNVYGDVAKLTTFFDGWSGGSAALAACTTPGYRLKTVYESAPVATLGDMVTQLSTPELSSVLTAMTDLTVTEFAMKLARYGTDEHSVNSMLSEQVSDTFALSEHHIYGSSRLGVQRYDSTLMANMRHETDTLNRLNGLKRWYSYSFGDLIDSTKKEPYGTEGNMDISTFKENPTEYVSRTLGRRYYELTDHLGNVLATVLDRKTGKGTRTAGGVTMYDRWHADIASATDYYPGGMMMPGRNTEYRWSRFGAQGSPKDDEVYGKGNFVDMGDRHLDTRILHTPKPDKQAGKYPSISPYTFAAGNPIYYTDPDGETIHVYGEAQHSYIALLQGATSLTVSFDAQTNKLTFSGTPVTPADQVLLNASNDAKIDVNMYATLKNGIALSGGGAKGIVEGAYLGSTQHLDGTVTAVQFVNPQQMEQVDIAGISNKSSDAAHELMEAFIAAQIGPGDNALNQTHGSVWDQAHNVALHIDPNAPPTDVARSPNGDVGVISKGGDKGTILFNENTMTTTTITAERQSSIYQTYQDDQQKASNKQYWNKMITPNIGKPAIQPGCFGNNKE